LTVTVEHDLEAYRLVPLQLFNGNSTTYLVKTSIDNGAQPAAIHGVLPRRSGEIRRENVRHGRSARGLRGRGFARPSRADVGDSWAIGAF